MMNRPLFFAGCVYLVMAAVSFAFWEFSAVISFVLVLFLLCSVMSRKSWKSLLVAAIASMVACTSVYTWQQNTDRQLVYDGTTLLAEGMITACRIYDSALCYSVEVPLETQIVTMDLWSYDMEPLDAGNRFSALLHITAYEEQYWNDGIILKAQTDSMTDLGMASGLKAECLRLRRLVQQRIETLFHGKGKELMLGILLGEKAELSMEVEEVFHKSGALHLLTVSGFHFSIMAGALFAFFGFLQLNPKYCALLSVPFLLVLLLLEGSTVSVQRAAIMTALAFLAKILERDYDGLSSWGAALLCILIPEPILMFSKSFILSFSAVLGILLFAPILRCELTKIIIFPKQTRAYGLCRRVLDVIAISISANLLTAPFLLYFFSSLPFAAALSSVIVFPLLGPIMLLAVAAIILPIPLLATVFALAAQLLGGVLYRLLAVVAEWDWVYYGENNLLLFGIVFCYVLWLLFYLFGAKKPQVLCYTSIYALLLSAGLLWNSMTAESMQGYSCRSSLLLCKENSAVLIGSIEKEQDLHELRRILRSEKVEQIDLFYLTANKELHEIHLLEFVDEWKPKYIVSAEELSAFDLREVQYSCNPAETVRFWNDWTFSFTENAALLCGNERKFLKLHEKYAIMTMYQPEYTAILGDDSMIYGDASMLWTKTWGGTLKFTLEVRDDSGTGKPAFDTNQRG